MIKTTYIYQLGHESFIIGESTYACTLIGEVYILQQQYKHNPTIFFVVLHAL